MITLLIATPIGVGSAVYLNEYAKPGNIVCLIVFTTETLSGIPSIIFGLFGMRIFRKYTGTGLFYSHRFPDTDLNDPSADHKNYPGSFKDSS